MIVNYPKIVDYDKDARGNQHGLFNKPQINILKNKKIIKLLEL